MKRIDPKKLEQEILKDFFEHNVISNTEPALTRQIAEIAARMVVIAVAKIQQED